MKTGKGSREDELEEADELADDPNDKTMDWVDDEGDAPPTRGPKKPKQRPREEDVEVRDKKRRERDRKRARGRDDDWE